MLDRLLRHHAFGSPDRPLIISARVSLSYGDAVARAVSLSSGLRNRSITRFACVVNNATQLVPLLAGAAAIGAEPCVYRTAADVETIGALAHRFEHTTVVVDDRCERPHIDGVSVLHIDELAADDPPDVEESSATAPLLVLTTGTTGDPKGARHDWNRLAAGVRPAAEPGSRRWLLAYNLNQFAGLQVLLHAIVSGDTIVVPESNQPRVALDFMRVHDVTHVSATPTFWRFLVALLDQPGAVRPDLQQVTLGGEAVPAPLLDELARLFPRARISQVYAATEAGSAVSVRDGSSGLPLSVLERPAADDVQFRIVDGQLEVRSRVGMLGYYGDDENGDDWRPTGDLVEIRDGRIHFIGRTNEVINVGGVKVHPLPIEHVISKVDGVELVHVYGRSNPVAGAIVVADVVARDGVDTDDLEDRIRDACEALPDASQPRRVRFVDALELRDFKVVRSG